MSTSKDILDDAELAKSYITNSALSDDYKRIYLRLINISTLATNGISPEEKIQKMTECIQLLAVTQGMYLANIDDKIEKAIEKANNKKCENCKAMAHANDIEKEKADREAFKSYLQRLGITEHELLTKLNKPKSAHTSSKDQSWSDVLKNMLSKPYIYAVFGLAVFSPYSTEIIRMLIQAFGH